MERQWSQDPTHTCGCYTYLLALCLSRASQGAPPPPAAPAMTCPAPPTRVTGEPSLAFLASSPNDISKEAPQPTRTHHRRHCRLTISRPPCGLVSVSLARQQESGDPIKLTCRCQKGITAKIKLTLSLSLIRPRFLSHRNKSPERITIKGCNTSAPGGGFPDPEGTPGLPSSSDGSGACSAGA